MNEDAFLAEGRNRSERAQREHARQLQKAPPIHYHLSANVPLIRTLFIRDALLKAKHQHKNCWRFRLNNGGVDQGAGKGFGASERLAK